MGWRYPHLFLWRWQAGWDDSLQKIGPHYAVWYLWRRCPECLLAAADFQIYVSPTWKNTTYEDFFQASSQDHIQDLSALWPSGQALRWQPFPISYSLGFSLEGIPDFIFFEADARRIERRGCSGSLPLRQGDHGNTMVFTAEEHQHVRKLPTGDWDSHRVHAVQPRDSSPASWSFQAFSVFGVLALSPGWKVSFNSRTLQASFACSVYYLVLFSEMVCGFSNWMMQWPFYHIYAAMTLSRSFAVGLVQARSGPEQALFCRLSSWCSFLWRLTLQDLLGTMLKRMVRMLSSMHIWAWSHMSGMWWLRMVQFWGPSLPCPAVCGFSNWMMQWPFYHIYAAITLLWPWAGPLLLALCRPVLALSRPFFADLALGAAFYGGWPCKTCWAQC